MAAFSSVDMLMTHAVAPWFPRSIDREYGGFLCDFDRRWKECGPHRKRLEFQARQTLAAAEFLIVYPEDAMMAEAVRTGFEFLRGPLWDSEYGGWYAATDRAGKPQQPVVKHSHGMAYAAQACFAVYAATADRSARDLANTAMEWLDTFARDDLHLGYFGPLWRDGTVQSESANGQPTDMIGTPFGWKDMNVNNDFYELSMYAVAIAGSYRSAGSRLEEQRDLLLRHYATPGEIGWHLFTRSWEPAGAERRPGTAVQAAGRLLEDRSAPDLPMQERAARLLIDWAVGHGSDPATGAIRHSIDVKDPKPSKRDLHWWCQFELLKASSYLAFLHPEDEELCDLRGRAEKLVASEVIDGRFGGSRALISSALDWRARYFHRSNYQAATRKGYEWKDASHDVRDFLRLLGLEQGHLGPGPPRPATSQVGAS